jgi:hypothetical protein
MKKVVPAVSDVWMSFMGQIVGRSAHFRVVAIGAFATRRLPIPVKMAIMLGYMRDKWSCDRRADKILYLRRHGQLKAGNMVDQSAEITSIFPYLVEGFRRLLACLACANTQKPKELLCSM